MHTCTILKICPWVVREKFSLLVAILDNLKLFLINLFLKYLFQINKFQNMPGRGKGKAKAKPKPKKKFIVPIGFDDLDLNYGMFMMAQLMDVLMGG